MKAKPTTPLPHPRDARDNAGMTQIEMATALGKPAGYGAYISRMETKGEYPRDFEVRRAWFRVLGLTEHLEAM